MTDIRRWLAQNGLGRHAELFAENEIDFDVLLELAESDLESMGLALGARKKLKSLASRRPPSAFPHAFP